MCKKKKKLSTCDRIPGSIGIYVEERGGGGLTKTAEKSKCRLKIKKVGITEAKGEQHFKREGMDNTVKGSQ